MGSRTSPEQERLKSLLSETVVLLCKNGLQFKKYVKIQGLLGITLDEEDIFLIHLNEILGETKEPENTATSEKTNAAKSKQTNTAKSKQTNSKQANSKACGCKRKINTRSSAGTEKPTKNKKQNDDSNSSGSAEDSLPSVTESLSRQVISEKPKTKRTEPPERSTTTGGKIRAEIDLTVDEETKKEEDMPDEKEEVKPDEPLIVPTDENRVPEVTPQNRVVMNHTADPMYYQTVQPQLQQLDPMMLGYVPNTLYTTAVSQPREIVPMTNPVQTLPAQYAPPVGNAQYAPPVGNAQYAPPVGNSQYAPPVGNAQYAPSVSNAQYAPPVGNPYITSVMRNVHQGDNTTLIQDAHTGAVIQLSQNQEAPSETLSRITDATSATSVGNVTPDVQVIEATPQQSIQSPFMKSAVIYNKSIQDGTCPRCAQILRQKYSSLKRRRSMMRGLSRDELPPPVKESIAASSPSCHKCHNRLIGHREAQMRYCKKRSQKKTIGKHS